MVNKSFDIYKEDGVSLSGVINNNCLHLESFIYGKFGDSEKYYDFTEEDTRKIFELLPFEEFINFLQIGKLEWLEKFLEKNEINVKSFYWTDFN